VKHKVGLFGPGFESRSFHPGCGYAEADTAQCNYDGGVLNSTGELRLCGESVNAKDCKG